MFRRKRIENSDIHQFLSKVKHWFQNGGLQLIDWSSHSHILVTKGWNLRNVTFKTRILSGPEALTLYQYRFKQCLICTGISSFTYSVQNYFGIHLKQFGWRLFLYSINFVRQIIGCYNAFKLVNIHAAHFGTHLSILSSIFTISFLFYIFLHSWFMRYNIVLSVVAKISLLSWFSLKYNIYIYNIFSINFGLCVQIIIWKRDKYISSDFLLTLVPSTQYNLKPSLSSETHVFIYTNSLISFRLHSVTLTIIFSSVDSELLTLEPLPFDHNQKLDPHSHPFIDSNLDHVFFKLSTRFFSLCLVVPKFSLVSSFVFHLYTASCFSKVQIQCLLKGPVHSQLDQLDVKTLADKEVN